MKNRHKFKHNEKLLDKEEEYKLIENWQKNKNNNSINKLLSSYKKLVVSISKKFSSYGLPQEDLIQEGTMGLVYAIERFDTSKGFRLYTYSHWWIKAMIQDYIIKNWSIVKMGSTNAQKTLFFSFNKIKKLINLDTLKNMDRKDVEAISKVIKMKPVNIENLHHRLKMGDQSLNEVAKINDTSVELIDFLKDDRDSQHTILEKNDDIKLKQKWILEAMDSLNEREKFIINSRKLNEKAKTLGELGKILKISQERVRQIESISLQKLKKNLLNISNETKDFFVS
tara:strand:+ start:218 stop:1066 length:849 start_codon:yes stop_codon:yes gene_type:complete